MILWKARQEGYPELTFETHWSSKSINVELQAPAAKTTLSAWYLVPSTVSTPLQVMPSAVNRGRLKLPDLYNFGSVKTCWKLPEGSLHTFQIQNWHLDLSRIVRSHWWPWLQQANLHRYKISLSTPGITILSAVAPSSLCLDVTYLYLLSCKGWRLFKYIIFAF